MEKQFRCTQFREYFIASFLAIIAQLHAIKWPSGSNHAIARNGIPIGTPKCYW